MPLSVGEKLGLCELLINVSALPSFTLRYHNVDDAAAEPTLS
jgi:hypothetical protein